ncbi:ABC transporter ATP-binding protein [Labrenzia sp. OB1]|uniref:ABC transporter ATP-binding protein n=1 Tax=Labrenzia sp. OB1 TaxID=1561204 RepID=UPI0007B262F2|nr:ABC transporter ATP-binding protein [Labrenzia sp. OB1]KZM51161.1 branched-chain amino acid ABC transporter ATP-binding protein [Labrenzia sp. OB1]
MPDAVLTVDAVTAGYVPDLPILRSVTLTAERGKLTVIIGPNGAGKSTLIKAVYGLVPISDGIITADGKGILGLSPDRMTSVGIAYVPQSDNVFRTLTIRQNLDLALQKHARADEKLSELYARFPVLADKQRDRAGSLSGGQRQFLAVAMALAADPGLILMDEPSAGLSPKAAEEVLDHAKQLTGQGVTILLVEQNVKQALKRADHCYVLAEGRNQIDGPAADLLQDPALGRIYLGRERRAQA